MDEVDIEQQMYTYLKWHMPSMAHTFNGTGTAMKTMGL